MPIPSEPHHGATGNIPGVPSASYTSGASSFPRYPAEHRIAYDIACTRRPLLNLLLSDGNIGHEECASSVWAVRVMSCDVRIWRTWREQYTDRGRRNTTECVYYSESKSWPPLYNRWAKLYDMRVSRSITTCRIVFAYLGHRVPPCTPGSIEG